MKAIYSLAAILVFVAASAAAKVYKPVDPYWDPACEDYTKTTTEVIDPGEFFTSVINLTSCTQKGLMYIDWAFDGKSSSRIYMDEERYGYRWQPYPYEVKDMAGELTVKDGHHRVVWQNKSKYPATMSVTTTVYPLN